MKMCQPHWEELRAAIDARGLTPLVADGGKQAMRNIESEVNDGSTIANFDPLMAAHNAIWSNCMNLAGLTVMAPNDDGSERCAYCYILAEAPKHGVADGRFDNWIDLAADGAKRQYESLLASARPSA